VLKHIILPNESLSQKTTLKLFSLSPMEIVQMLILPKNGTHLDDESLVAHVKTLGPKQVNSLLSHYLSKDQVLPKTPIPIQPQSFQNPQGR
jgi:hypothetical protein